MVQTSDIYRFLRHVLRGVVLTTVCIAASTNAQTHITGDVHAMNFDVSGNPYIVEQDIFVPAGKKLTIDAGVIFLFKAFTGLHVQGQVLVDGTGGNPVIFTSIHDDEYNPNSEQFPNPFDWNGILISKESTGATLKHFHLRYSVYGIKAQTQNIKIESGIFRQNGQFHFTINDKIQYVQDNIPYSHNTDDRPAADIDDDSDDGGSITVSSSGGRVSKQKKIFRYTCLGIGITGTVIGTIFSVRAIQRSNRLDDMYNSFHDGTWKQSWPNELSYNDEYQSVESQFNASRTGAILSYSIGGAALVGFVLTFVF
jgi:hypothetical protein